MGIGHLKIGVLGIVELNVSMQGVCFDKTVPFAVVPTDLTPFCCILGANFISSNEMVVDFHNDTALLQ